MKDTHIMEKWESVKLISHKVGDYIEIEAKAISEIDKRAYPNSNIVIWTSWKYFYCKATPELTPGMYYATILDDYTLSILG